MEHHVLYLYYHQGELKNMAFDAFISIDGIDGESTDDKHQGWSEILSFGCSHSQTVSRTASSAGGAGAERADFRNFQFEKLLDKASPKLALACASGIHIDKITFEICRAGTEKIKYMEITMSNCFISDYSVVGDGEDAFPIESTSIDYGKIQWVYTQQRREGGVAAGNIATGWNLETNSKV
jgi:type VI secretion system secreted protein Hcp